MPAGYSAGFLKGNLLEMPTITPANPLIQNPLILPYTHFTVAFSKNRKMPVYTAVNIDGKNFVQINRESDRWQYEPALAKTDHIGEDFYEQTNEKFHKGHIVRRIDPSWGDEAEKGQQDTFHYTNACPQHCKFNPAIWLELERNILEKGAVAWDQKLCVFAGPVISEMDKPSFIKPNGDLIFIPSRFWKIVVWNKQDDRRAAVGFMQSQQEQINNLVDLKYGMGRTMRNIDKHLQNLTFKKGAVYQVPISKIEKVAGLAFPLNGIYLPRVPDMKELKEEPVPTDVKYRAFRHAGLPIISVGGMILD